jgi:hypothetical protein
VDPGDSSLDALLAIPTMTDTPFGASTVIRDGHAYDHALFQRQYLTEYTGRHGVDRFDERLFGDYDYVASKACSDHRPVWIVLRIPERDDD